MSSLLHYMTFNKIPMCLISFLFTTKNNNKKYACFFDS